MSFLVLDECETLLILVEPLEVLVVSTESTTAASSGSTLPILVVVLSINTELTFLLFSKRLGGNLSIGVQLYSLLLLNGLLLVLLNNGWHLLSSCLDLSSGIVLHSMILTLVVVMVMVVVMVSLLAISREKRLAVEGSKESVDVGVRFTSIIANLGSRLKSKTRESLNECALS